MQPKALSETELMTELINRRGYLVVGTNVKCKTGGTLAHDPPLENAFTILGPTTREDANEQLKVVLELTGYAQPWPIGWYFYRVGTD